MILQNFYNRFLAMRENNKHITCVLDIGAYRGDFTETIKAIWPMARVWQFEADGRQVAHLQRDAFVGLLLGDVEANVDYYTLPDDKITTGSSIFKEQTEHYADGKFIRIVKPMVTLDSLLSELKLHGNWAKNGLVKIDTQGSEQLILEGAKEFLATKQPKYMLIECSVKEYNAGAPLIGDMVSYLNSIGYQISDVFDLSYNQRGELLQTDLLFIRK